MSVELLSIMKQQADSLTVQEKVQLATYLNEKLKQTEQSQQTDKGDSSDLKEIKRQRNMEWLKANWEEYRGLYVALDGGQLVGQGATISEADQQAKQQGIKKPLLVRVPNEGEALYSGW